MPGEIVVDALAQGLVPAQRSLGYALLPQVVRDVFSGLNSGA
jgi:hypothetical protein